MEVRFGCGMCRSVHHQAARRHARLERLLAAPEPCLATRVGFKSGSGPPQLVSFSLGVDSPFFSTIVLFKNGLFPLGVDGFLKEGSLDRMEMEGTPRFLVSLAQTNNTPNQTGRLAQGSQDSAFCEPKTGPQATVRDRWVLWLKVDGCGAKPMVSF